VDITAIRYTSHVTCSALTRTTGWSNFPHDRPVAVQTFSVLSGRRRGCQRRRLNCPWRYRRDEVGPCVGCASLGSCPSIFGSCRDASQERFWPLHQHPPFSFDPWLRLLPKEFRILEDHYNQKKTETKTLRHLQKYFCFFNIV